MPRQLFPAHTIVLSIVAWLCVGPLHVVDAVDDDDISGDSAGTVIVVASILGAALLVVGIVFVCKSWKDASRSSTMVLPAVLANQRTFSSGQIYVVASHTALFQDPAPLHAAKGSFMYTLPKSSASAPIQGDVHNTLPSTALAPQQALYPMPLLNYPSQGTAGPLQEVHRHHSGLAVDGIAGNTAASAHLSHLDSRGSLGTSGAAMVRDVQPLTTLHRAQSSFATVSGVNAVVDGSAHRFSPAPGQGQQLMSTPNPPNNTPAGTPVHTPVPISAETPAQLSGTQMAASRVSPGAALQRDSRRRPSDASVDVTHHEGVGTAVVVAGAQASTASTHGGGGATAPAASFVAGSIRLDPLPTTHRAPTSLPPISAGDAMAAVAHSRLQPRRSSAFLLDTQGLAPLPRRSSSISSASNVTSGATAPVDANTSSDIVVN